MSSESIWSCLLSLDEILRSPTGGGIRLASLDDEELTWLDEAVSKKRTMTHVMLSALPLFIASPTSFFADSSGSSTSLTIATASCKNVKIITTIEVKKKKQFQTWQTSLEKTSHSPSLARIRNSRESSIFSSCFFNEKKGLGNSEDTKIICNMAMIQVKITWISGSATTYCFRRRSPNARETASIPPTLQVPIQLTKATPNTHINLELSIEKKHEATTVTYLPTSQTHQHSQSFHAHHFGQVYGPLTQQWLYTHKIMLHEGTYSWKKIHLNGYSMILDIGSLNFQTTNHNRSSKQTNYHLRLCW